MDNITIYDILRVKVIQHMSFKMMDKHYKQSIPFRHIEKLYRLK